MWQRYDGELLCDDGLHRVEVAIQDGQWRIALDDGEKSPPLEALSLRPGQWMLRDGEGRVHELLVTQDGDRLWVWVDGDVFTLKPPPEVDFGQGEELGGGEIESPMPGTVISVAVQKGDTVEAKAPLLILEAMKMENTLVAPFAGVVREVFVSQGDLVDGGQTLVVVEKEEES